MNNSKKDSLNCPDNTITIKPVKEKPQFTNEELEAIKRFQSGEKWGCSTFIDEDTIVAGYGHLDNKNPYDFDFPLPIVYIRAIYGTISWAKWRKNIEEQSSRIAVKGKTVFYNEMLENMQYYMEYCQNHGYVTPKDWLENFKHF